MNNFNDYERGLNEGREEARKEFEHAYLLLSKHANELLLENHMLNDRLDQQTTYFLFKQKINLIFKRIKKRYCWKALGVDQ
jgi:hypothetical protein